MFPIFAGNSAATGYNIARSIRTRASASGYLSRTPASAGNRQTWTWSSWVKRGTQGTSQGIFAAATSGSALGELYFNTSNALSFYDYTGAYNLQLVTTQVFRDPSAWYHIVVALDTTNATAANRVKIYVNGTQVTALSTATYPSQNYQGYVNNNIAHYLSSYNGSADLYDGYLAEVNFIDGQALTPTSFGSFDSLTGVWKPARYAGSYGTNGTYPNFSDNSALTTSSNVGLGKDFSGNANYWVTNNISITAGATYDSMTDVPTLTSATAANYCVLNPIASGRTLSAGNLNYAGATSGIPLGTIGVTTGKWYWEFTPLDTGCAVGAASIRVSPTITFLGQTVDGWSYVWNGQTYNNNASTSGISSYTTGDIIGIAVDVDAGKIWFAKNNTWQASGDPATGANPRYSNLNGYAITPSAGNNTTLDSAALNCGQRPFTYTPPTGFVALNTYNLPTSTIVKGNTVMDATLYTGTLLSNAITNAASFKPDLVWVKSRSAATGHKLTDSVRGVTKALLSNSANPETTDTQGLTAFNTNGFTVGTDTVYNNLAATYVAWQWQAGQGSSGSNTNGSITSSVSVNASAGFSVVTYTGTGANATVGHGLGVAPSLILIKRRNTAADWVVYHSSVGNTSALFLDSSVAASANSVYFNNTSPTSSVFSIGTAVGVNSASDTYVAYCWAAIGGLSAFGSYTGNDSNDGPFAYLGFRPKFVMFKASSIGSSWIILDSARDSYNVDQYGLAPDNANAESTYSGLAQADFLSNGFKIRANNTNIYWNNSSGSTVVYMAWAENPFKNSLAR